VKRSAFTFIEIMVVIALIGVIATVLLPRMMRRPVAVEWSVILDNLNHIISFTRQEAIANQRLHRIVFNARFGSGDDVITIEDEHDDPEKPGRKIFRPVSSYYFPTQYDFAPSVKIDKVLLNKRTIINEKGMACCYVIPDGLVQEITVHLVRKINNVETDASFVMNPFWGRFELHDGLVK